MKEIFAVAKKAQKKNTSFHSLYYGYKIELALDQEHRIGISRTGGHGFKSRWSLELFLCFLSNCFSCFITARITFTSKWYVVRNGLANITFPQNRPYPVSRMHTHNPMLKLLLPYGTVSEKQVVLVQDPRSVPRPHPPPKETLTAGCTIILTSLAPQLNIFESQYLFTIYYYSTSHSTCPSTLPVLVQSSWKYTF